jgi:kynurenine formamidase
VPEFVEAPSPDQVDKLFQAHSNWRRWGEGDQLGTLNLVTADKQRDAASLVRDGKTIPMARTLRPRREADNHTPVLHLMRRSGEGAGAGFATTSDWFGLTFHGFGITHVDALCHVLWNGLMYNAASGADVSTARGALRNSVMPLSRGVVTRGVLLDAPRALDIPWLEPGVGLVPEDLEACLAKQGVELEPGDALIVRTGRDARREKIGAEDPIVDGLGGLAASCLPWIHERDVGILISDGTSDVMRPGAAPHLMPVHVVALVAMGMPLVDNAYLEELSRQCEAVERWAFMFMMAPLSLQGGTGSPVTPLAVL